MLIFSWASLFFISFSSCGYDEDDKNTEYDSYMSKQYDKKTNQWISIQKTSYFNLSRTKAIKRQRLSLKSYIIVFYIIFTTRIGNVAANFRIL